MMMPKKNLEICPYLDMKKMTNISSKLKSLASTPKTE
jgi:hypothetical protein